MKLAGIRWRTRLDEAPEGSSCKETEAHQRNQQDYFSWMRNVKYTFTLLLLAPIIQSLPQNARLIRSAVLFVHLMIFKQSTHLLIHLPDSGSTWLLFRFHSSSWHNPLVWVPTAAHQYHLPGEKPSSQLCGRVVTCQKHASGTHWFGNPHHYCFF